MYVKNITIGKKINILSNTYSKLIIDITPTASTLKTMRLSLDAKGIYKYFEHIKYLFKSHIGIVYIDEAFLNQYASLLNIKLNKLLGTDKVLLLNTNIDENLYSKDDIKSWQENFQIKNTIPVSTKDYSTIQAVKLFLNIDSFDIKNIKLSTTSIVPSDEMELIELFLNRSSQICIADFRNNNLENIKTYQYSSKVMTLISMGQLFKTKAPNKTLREILAYISS